MGRGGELVGEGTEGRERKLCLEEEEGEKNVAVVEPQQCWSPKRDVQTQDLRNAMHSLVWRLLGSWILIVSLGRIIKRCSRVLSRTLQVFTSLTAEGSSNTLLSSCEPWTPPCHSVGD